MQPDRVEIRVLTGWQSRFALQVLQRDGLHAEPFVRHGPGSGELRACGMDAAAWTDWFTRIVRSEVAFHSLALGPRVRTSPSLDVPPWFQPWFLPQPSSSQLWRGPSEAWEVIDRWAHEPSWQRSRTEAWSASIERLFESLHASEHMINTRTSDWLLGSVLGRRINLWVVDYPGPVSLAIRPRTVAVGVVGWEVSHEEMSEFVLDSIEELLERQMQHDR